MKYADKFNCFLFDWDGCLADTLGLWLESYREVFLEYGLKVTDEQIVAQFGTLGAGPKQLGISVGDECFGKVQSLVVTKLPKVKLNPNALETLKTLKLAGKKIAILTSSTRASILPAVEYYQITSLIDLVLGKEDIVKHKPDPEIVHRSLDYLKCAKEETVIIGDSSKDILCGRAAGISTMIYYPEVNHKYYTEADLKNLKPDLFITDFQELLVC